MKVCIFIFAFICIDNEVGPDSLALARSICSSLLGTDVVFLSLAEVQTPGAAQRSLAHLLGSPKRTHHKFSPVGAAGDKETLA